jgi:signal transduction histidine kinase/ActR/RegA family two-component response regulator
MLGLKTPFDLVMEAFSRLQGAPSREPLGLLRRYGMAVLVTGLTLMVSLALRLVLEDAVPLVLFILAVMVSAWYGGLGPGVLSSLLSVMAGNYFLMEPARSFALSSPADWLRVASFLVTAGVVSSLSEAMHEARRQAEHQAWEAERGRRELERADRQKDEFLAMLAHELRNPLAPIHNAVQILSVRGHHPAEVERIRGLIERQLRQMVRLVDDLLDMSRITRGKINLCKETVDLARVVSTAVETSLPLIESKGHELTVLLPETPLQVYADATRLAQVVSNLLNNAAKYTEPAGRIGLAVERLDGEARVSVRDTGIGIAPDMLPRVFDLFMQAESSADRAQGGLGVGLSLVRRLVEMHGGRVEAHSAGLGRGTEMVVRLPVPPGPVAEEAPAAPAVRSPQAGAAGAFRILIVDDNEDSAESLAVLMELAGHEVRTAFEGLSALEEARTFRPGVVLLDIGLPNLDGYEVARRLCQEPGRDRMLLLAMTGYSQEEDRRRSREAGFDHHLVKPVDLDKLRGLLDSWCHGRATAGPRGRTDRGG